MNRIVAVWLKLLCLFAPVALPAQTFHTLVNFIGAEGTFPQGSLIQGTNGDIYGTASLGGNHGAGDIFQVTSNGTLTTLNSLCSQSGCPYGKLPYAGVLQAKNGEFYGTTQAGGIGNALCADGSCGTLFKIAPSGTATTLYSFCSQTGCMDGSTPQGLLVQASSGDIYGTTASGGVNNSGTIFRVTPGGVLTTLYSFCSQPECTDGASPVAGLIQGVDGELYGTTAGGGTSTQGCAPGCGTVFRITSSGSLTTLHSFCIDFNGGCPDGSSPRGALIQAANGNFYGTTYQGGTAQGSGTVFEITPSGIFKVIHRFCSQFGCLDGALPYAGVIQATDGNFYGVNSAGGTNGAGTVFKLTAKGSVTTLYSFCQQLSCPDGEMPWGALVQSTSGIFYGTTYRGGTTSVGTLFSLSVGLGPFVKTQTLSGSIGSSVIILGTNLTGATGVTFNGTPATFSVVSGSEILTTVPTGATTGMIQVQTPALSLSSNLPFRVKP